MAPRETENNAYAKFWGDKQRTLWYVMVFLEWSISRSKPLKMCVYSAHVGASPFCDGVYIVVQ